MQKPLGYPETINGDSTLNLTEEILQSLASGRKGAERPPDVVPGEMWTQEINGTQWRKYFWTGTDDILLFILNLEAKTVSFNAVTLSMFTEENEFVVGTGEGMAAVKTLAEVRTILGIEDLPTPEQLASMTAATKIINHALLGGM